MKTKINLAINGFGRIGRAALKIAWENPEINIVAINDLTDTTTLRHLLIYDSVYKKFTRNVEIGENQLIIDGQTVRVFGEKDPENLPWSALEIDVVIESSGHFTDRQGARKHLTAGAKKVIISAPSKGDNPAPTYVLGVNDVNDEADSLINNASCTTNCIAPVMAILESTLGIEKSMMTTIHAYTADQNLQDGPHQDLRRARAAGVNIVPTTTGAAIAATEAIPTLVDKFDGLAIRVPVIIGSISDITALVKKETTVSALNQIFTDQADQGRYKGILTVTNEPLVSSDIIGSTYSSIVDLSLTKVIGGNLVKVVAWYDNEWGYSCRLVEQVTAFGKTLRSDYGQN